jgi:hypothetical protein
VIESIFVAIGYLELCRRRRAILALRDARRPANLDLCLLVIEAARGRLLRPGLILIPVESRRDQ